MAEILFYHLTESRMEAALPDLLERCLGRGWRVVVQTATEERRDALDAHLWTYKDDSFLPHGADAGGNASMQPILLTVEPEQRANDAEVRFLVEGAIPGSLKSYKRGVYLFDGHDPEQVAAARERWRIEQAAGHDVIYWQQTDDRKWVKKA